MMVRFTSFLKEMSEFFTNSLEFAFYVNKTGWRSRKEFMVYWEGSPTGFGTCDDIVDRNHY